MDYLREPKRISVFLALALLALFVVASQLAGRTSDKAAKASAAKAMDASQYLGADTCKGCHGKIQPALPEFP